MFGSIGMTELILIAGVALVFLGPDRFPEFAKIVARTIRDVRGYVQDAQREISEELKPVKKELNELSRYNPEDYLERLADSATEDVGEEGEGEEAEGEDGEGEEAEGEDEEGEEGEARAGEEPWKASDYVEGIPKEDGGSASEEEGFEGGGFGV